MMAGFEEKIQKACLKKETLYDESKVKYAVRAMFAGAFLTMSTAAGAIAADVIAVGFPPGQRFLFSFIFSFGLIYVLFMNGDLATSNMMYLSAGMYYKQLRVSKGVKILLYCTFFNLIGAIILAWLFNQSVAFHDLTDHSYLIKSVQKKLLKPEAFAFFEGVVANIFVNVAVMSWLLLKEQSAKLTVILSAIFMFVFLGNEHLVANFASFMLASFSQVPNIPGLDSVTVLKQWVIVFFGNWIGGGLIIGVAYAWLNQTKTAYKED